MTLCSGIGLDFVGSEWMAAGTVRGLAHFSRNKVKIRRLV